MRRGLGLLILWLGGLGFLRGAYTRASPGTPPLGALEYGGRFWRHLGGQTRTHWHAELCQVEERVAGVVWWGGYLWPPRGWRGVVWLSRWVGRVVCWGLGVWVVTPLFLWALAVGLAAVGVGGLS